MSRCFVLGAGFSKAAGNLPVTVELIPRFREIHKKATEEGNPRLKHAGDMIFDFLGDLERQNFDEPYVRAVSGEKRLSSGIERNFEHILTFIDLYIDTIWQGRISKDGKTASLSGKGIGYRISNPRALREAFKIYLCQTLVKPNANDEERRLLTDFAKHLRRGDIVITFNYDLLLETALYQQGRWVPNDGYGIPFGIRDADVSESRLNESEIKILKLHGSLHWKYDKAFHIIHPDSGPEISRWNDDWTPVFPGYFLNDDPPWKQSGRKYAAHHGVHGFCGMLPSYIKEFDLEPFIAIWRMASEHLCTAEEVIVIGYSLPRQDSASVLLFADARIEDKILRVVDRPDCVFNVARHFSAVTGHQNPLPYQGLDNYLAQVAS